jgi:hypothetical protein
MKVIESGDSEVKFDNGLTIIGDGEVDCCASNYLDFEQLPVGTELPTMTAGQFADAITLKEDGFSVKDIDGTPKWVQARSEQNGYYSNMTTLIVKYEGKEISLGELSGELSD